jgi:hypothetical protein
MWFEELRPLSDWVKPNPPPDLLSIHCIPSGLLFQSVETLPATLLHCPVVFSLSRLVTLV